MGKKPHIKEDLFTQRPILGWEKNEPVLGSIPHCSRILHEYHVQCQPLQCGHSGTQGRPQSHLCRRQCQRLHLQHSLSQQELQEAPRRQHPAEGQKQLPAPHRVSMATASLRGNYPTGTVSTVPQCASHKPGLGPCEEQHYK